MIYSPRTNEAIYFELQGRVFKAGDLTRSLLLMCGGHFNNFYCEALKMPLAQTLCLFETWLEVRQEMNAANNNDLFKDVDYQ